MDKAHVVSKVAEQVVWWMGERRKKLEELRHETMSVNPFLAPLIFDIHGFSDFESLAGFLVAGHLATGYATGFGKLIDEKVLPRVFGTLKLDKKARAERPLNLSVFDEIDHVIVTHGGLPKLLSLKAGRWTIQLTMAVQLNKTFSELVNLRSAGKLGRLNFDEIAVGVFYGEAATLTDKYDIIRGINRGASHDVVDLRRHVNVYAGKKFWSWLNGGQDQTDEWVMEGIMEGLRQSRLLVGSLGDLVSAFSAEFASMFSGYVRPDGTIDWQGIAKSING
jgi:hypothetical protein